MSSRLGVDRQNGEMALNFFPSLLYTMDCMCQLLLILVLRPSPRLQVKTFFLNILRNFIFFLSVTSIYGIESTLMVAKG